MIAGFAVISKNLLEDLIPNFNTKKIVDGLERYEYYGEKISSKPRWESVFYSKDKILKGDIHSLSGYDSSKEFIRVDNIEYLIDMTDHVIIKIEMDDNDLYSTDLIMTVIGECGTVKQALDLMNSHNPSKNIKISFNTSMNFLLSIIFSEIQLDRKIVMDSSRVYNYTNKLLLENSEELDMNIYNLNIDNLKKIHSVDGRSLIFDGLKSSIKDEKIINELTVLHIDYLVNIATKQRMNTHTALICSLDKLNDETKLNLVDEIASILPSKQGDLLFTIFRNEFIEEHPELFIKYMYTSVYSYRVIEFLINNNKLVDISKIDKKRFIKASSLKRYNELAQYEDNPQITFMSDMINSAGTILTERVITLACFTNNYSEEEFKSMDIDPLADAVISKILSRFEYELNTNLLPMLGNRTTNMEYLSDKIVERMCETGVNTISRVKLIRENSSKRNDGVSLFNFLNDSLQKSENPKILRAILKLDI